MLSLTGSYNYYFCSDDITFRYRHKGLREYIKSHLHRDPHSGDIYIFMSKDCTRLRLYYFHHGGAILTEKILQGSRFLKPIFEDESKTTYHISWSDFVYLVEGTILKTKKVLLEEAGSAELRETEITYSYEETA